MIAVEDAPLDEEVVDLPAILSAIAWGSPEWIPVVVATTSGFLILLLISLLRARLTAGWKAGLFLLKATAVVLLGICLLDPQDVRKHFKPGENVVLFVADNSASMNVRQNNADARTRGQWANDLLVDPASAWQTRLAQDFDLRRYTFGSSLSHVEGFQDLKFDSPRSQLCSALTSLTDRFNGRPLAGIFLLTDGNSTDAVNIKGLPANIPIYPIVADKLETPGDIEIASVAVSQTNFEDAPVTIQATLASDQATQGNVIVRLAPTTISESQPQQELTLKVGGSEPAVARFEVKPTETGALFYKLQILPEDQPEIFTKPETSREATLANNEQLVAVNRDPHHYRILYVSGRPNFEHKFLGRALAEDDHLQLVSYVRIAKKEAKFDFRGRVGDGANSLFKGTGAQPSEEIEDYTQPVVKRLNTRDKNELSDGFPKTKAELYQYEAVILDDIEAAFFTQDQLTVLETFVSERGGGLLMLGGRDTFRHGKWEKTAMAHALPIYLDRVVEPLQGELKWQLTREGWLEPWMRIRSNERDEQTRLREVPLLEVVNNTSEIKPGARILAEVLDASGRDSPAFVAQQYGRGRTGAVLVGDLWRWSMTRLESDQDDLARVWRQVARWLVGDVPQRVQAVAEPDNSTPNPGMLLEIRVRDKEFQPHDQTLVHVTVKQPDGSLVKLDAQPSVKEPGLFEALHIARQPGAYVANIEVPGDEQEPPQTTSVGWVSNPAAEEFHHTAVNTSLLEEIARQTGGQVLTASALPDFVRKLSSRDLPVMETETTPLWHRPLLLVLVLTLLGLEWGLRRWKGLA